MYRKRNRKAWSSRKRQSRLRTCASCRTHPTLSASTPPTHLAVARVNLQLPNTPLKNVAPSNMQSNEQQSNEQQFNEQQVIAQLRRERDQALCERDQALCERDQALGERDQARGDLSQARDKIAHTEMQWDFCRQTVHRLGDHLEARDETILELNKKLEESHDDYMCSQDAHMSKAREAEKITSELATENRDYFHRQEMLISQLAMAHRETANAREELRK